VQFASQGAAVLANAADLTEGVFRAMFLAKLKPSAAALVAVVIPVRRHNGAVP